jgi:ferredoxin
MRERSRAGEAPFSTVDLALKTAAETVGSRLSFAGSVIDYRLETEGYSFSDAGPAHPPEVPPPSFADEEEAVLAVKRAARFLGADLVGIAALDRRWVYSHVWFDDQKKRAPLELPPDYRWAVVVATAMDYGTVTTAPSAAAFAASVMGYTNTHILIASLAAFIQNLGYRAIASGNDTALNIPLAIDAGLGEFSRSGLLITPRFGPRVRLGKVLTDLPLAPDHPITFGVRDFCRLCGNCARKCPCSAIAQDAPTWSGPSPATNPGVNKWYVDADRCLDTWMATGTACTACIAACPYNWPAAGGPGPGSSPYP